MKKATQTIEYDGVVNVEYKKRDDYVRKDDMTVKLENEYFSPKGYNTIWKVLRIFESVDVNEKGAHYDMVEMKRVGIDERFDVNHSSKLWKQIPKKTLLQRYEPVKRVKK